MMVSTSVSMGTEDVKTVIIVTSAVMPHTVAMTVSVTMAVTCCSVVMTVVMSSCSMTVSAVVMMTVSVIPVSLRRGDADQATHCC